MNDFTDSKWADSDFSRNYLDKADIYIVERKRMFTILRSFMSYYLPAPGKTKLLDLGCGDGIVTEELLQVDDSLSATLIDGSADMLEKAQKRLGGSGPIRYIQASFQELTAKEIPGGKYDFVVSSMAIHHLTLEEKKMLFSKVYSSLTESGYFVNIDVVRPPAEPLDAWYMKLWLEWMDDRKRSLGVEGEPSINIIERYKDLKENKPDTIEEQLTMLKNIGFGNVDCFYKYGIFSIYGGKKLDLG